MRYRLIKNMKGGQNSMTIQCNDPFNDFISFKSMAFSGFVLLVWVALYFPAIFFILLHAMAKLLIFSQSKTLS